MTMLLERELARTKSVYGSIIAVTGLVVAVGRRWFRDPYEPVDPRLSAVHPKIPL
jgi:hypothetical protein